MTIALNLDWITPELAVGGRFATTAAEHLAEVLGIRHIVDLRVEDRDDEQLLRHHGITLLHLPTRDLAAVSQDMLAEGVRWVNDHLDQGERVLIHCEHGIGRSALLALCVLVSRGMTPLEALELAKSRRPRVSPSPAQYDAFCGWLEAFRRERDVAWEVPHFDAFKAIAYRHLDSGT